MVRSGPVDTAFFEWVVRLDQVEISQATKLQVRRRWWTVGNLLREKNVVVWDKNVGCIDRSIED